MSELGYEPKSVPATTMAAPALKADLAVHSADGS